MVPNARLELARFLMVPNARLELARPFGHNHLKVACLPIPPAGHWVNVFLSNTGVIIH